MPRAIRVLPAAARDGSAVIDTLILPSAQRQVQRGFLFGAGGTCVELDLAEPVRLRTDDALFLDDGTLVEIVAEAEPLVEVRAADVVALARLAWHLGDRHVPVQILDKRLRLARDPAVEALLTSLGAKTIMIDAPFEPEGGAYATPTDGHEHHHHDHGHSNEHHAHEHHVHGPECAHDHGHSHHDPAHHDHAHHDHAHDHKHR